MAQVIPRYSFGSELGKSLGTGLGQGLQSLASLKLKELEQRQQSGRLKEEGLPGVLAYLEPQVQAQYVRNSQAAQLMGQQKQQESANQAIIDKLKTGQLSPQPVDQQDGLDPLAQQIAQEQPQDTSAPEAIQQFIAGTPKTPEARLVSQNERLIEALDNPGVNATQKQAIQLAVDKNNKQLDTIKNSRQAKFGKELEKLHTDYTAAKERMGDYNRLDELNESGDLPTTTHASYLKGLGLDIPALLGESGEEFQKVTQNFVRRAKEYYGGRISNIELEQFLRTVPSLLQSPEGRKRVTAQMRRLDKMKIASYKEAQKIVGDNKGITPENLWGKVDDKLKVQREKIAKRFQSDLKRTVPEASNRLAVGAANIAGRATLPAIGAGIGSLIAPGLGTAIGAGAGFGASQLGNILKSLGG